MVSLQNSNELLEQTTIDLPRLGSQLRFLRDLSYQTDWHQLSSESKDAVTPLLLKLAGHADFFQASPDAWRWQEQFSVLSYRYPPEDATKRLELLGTLRQITSQLPNGQLAADYALWEAIRAQAFLAFDARNQDDLKQLLNQSEWHEPVLALVPKASDWQLEHLLWLLAYQHVLLPDEAQEKLDQAVMAALQTHPQLTQEERQQLFSWRYLTNSFRVRDNCQGKFADWCILPPLEQALPHQHLCHDGLVIRYRSISNQQLQQLCQQMMAQEDDFHQLLATGRQPVANDWNDRLEVIIFDDYSDYNLFGSLHFNIRTNNGGMYIEGTPSDPDNQARFFAFQQFWQAKPFAVWNLEHEYIHYLDGRYASYGPFGHFPSHKVWWSEGLAELISLGADNPRAIRMLQDTPIGEEPSLSQIFAASYQDGLDLTYRWSYFAWRFLQRELPAEIPKLTQALRTDFFTGYLRQLEQLAADHQANFSDFLAEKRRQTTDDRIQQPPLLGRYLYRSYLQPAHLPITVEHFHRLQLTTVTKEPANDH
ncbi:collagenase [Alkalimonas amylolytica]|uniref:Microbial collagenase n=1 Tax=Alkalimonas amylolytica TaxID=152573 RepID=A0A1H4EX31_ALKAM|nr:collagenase [Alkalimonas amylolytica]SEA89519.1 microbial collagenase [Alkalimonas amylolytica]